MKELPPSLAGWSDYPQFILCQEKIPVNPAGETINPHDSANWMGHEEACSYSELLSLGVGFVFTAADPFWFLDLDHCMEDGRFVYNPIAQQMTEVFDGAAFEVSTSKTGVHFFGCGTVPPHSSKNKEYGIEFYTEGRFVLLTGDGAHGDVWLDWSEKLPWLVDSYFPPKAIQISEEWRDTPVPEWNGITDDEVLIAKLMQQKKFGGRASVADLMAGNEQILGVNYPSLNERDPYDRSSADAALANHLAFWTGKNHTRIWTIMCRSALLREKWNKHKNYLAITISNAVNGCQNVYGTQTPGDSSQPINDATITTGTRFMSPHQQQDYFDGCYYITQLHGILIPNGLALKPDQFKAVYGGYTFAMDARNERTTKNPWEAFIDNQAVHFPRVDGTTFDPKLEPRKIIIEDGLKLINTYVPLSIKRIKGDPSRFLAHLHTLFPDRGDRDIFMAYMAAMVQHQGTKFQWCPIIQGVEGNGKTLFGRCVEAAIGSRYCHSPKASDLSSGGLKFNGWIVGKCGIFIEELFSSDRFNLHDGIKPMMTNDRIEVQFKGRDQYTAYVIANFMMFSNHKDPIKITYDQRRYWMHYCPQQTEADIRRDGMGGRYFVEIYDWLKNHDGYAIVAEYLWTYQIPAALNPATELQRAPRSTSTDEAVLATMGPVEQHILEAVEEERQGFRGGYISSYCLDELLKEIRSERLSPYRRLLILQGLGYTRHPYLRNGRVDNPVMSEGGKPILYYKGVLDTALMNQSSLVKQDYEHKQGYSEPGVRAV